MRNCISAVASILILGSAIARPDEQKSAIDLQLAEQYLQEAARLWKADGGKLWGRPLDGPMIFVDRATRQAVANRADSEGHLRAVGGVFTGRLPDAVQIANMSVKWAGTDWIMVMWPLPRNAAERGSLLMHESWHRIQNDLGLPPTGPNNAHLDTLEGRYLLQLEWRALAIALNQRGDPRRTAIEDALLFRAERRRKFPSAAADERLLEMHEGIAEYTGVRLCGLDAAEQARMAAGLLERRPAEMPTFVRSFAYLSGPAYGVLLDAAAPNWHRKAKASDDLGALLQTAAGVTPPEPDRADLAGRARRYDGDQLRAKEEERDRQRQQKIAAIKARFVDGPVLTIPLEKMQVSFDPNATQPVDGLGSVYMGARIIDAFGTLTAPQGVLIRGDFMQATVPAPKDPQAHPLTGDGWTLQLADGRRLEPGARKGDWRVVGEKR
jgi:hypothetical protein